MATQLLGALASTVGTELCCQFVLPEIISLADDPVFRVRKAAALKVGHGWGRGRGRGRV